MWDAHEMRKPVAAEGRRGSMDVRRMTMAQRVALGALLALLSAESRAGDYEDPGFYIVVGGVTAFEQFDRVQAPAEVDPSLGVKIKTGYRFTPMLSAEVGLDFLTGFDIDLGPIGEVEIDPGDGDPVRREIVDGDLNLNGVLFTANVRVDLPPGMVLLTPRLKPFAALGLGVMWAQVRADFPTDDTCIESFVGWWCQGVFAQLSSSTAFATRFTLGMEYFVTDEWALVLDGDYVLPTGDLRALNYFSLGWAVRLAF
jgi:opacity protein-like surface antigen